MHSPGIPFLGAGVALKRSFSQTNIMEMECEIFISNLKNPELVSPVDESIRCISDGTSPHRAGALKLGLKKAVELKKQSMDALLRCRVASCAWNKNPVSYSAVGSGSRCQICHRYGMMCAVCGEQRTNSSPTLYVGCGKKFR